MRERLFGNPEAPLPGILTEWGKFCPRNFERWALTERALGWGGGMSVFTPGVGRRGRGTRLKHSAGVGEGGSPAVSIGRADQQELATVDVPATETVGALSGWAGRREKQINIFFIFQETKKMTWLLEKLKQFAISRLSKLSFPG